MASSNPTAVECLLALAMGTHERLGRSSPLRWLNRDLLEKIGDKVTPRLEEIEMFVRHHQVHAIEEHDGRDQYVVSRPRAFDFKVSLFRKPEYLTRHCKNIECQQDFERVHGPSGSADEAAQGTGKTLPPVPTNRRGRVQCTCRSILRFYDDIKFTVVLEHENGTPVEDGPNGEKPLQFSRFPGKPKREDGDYSTVACGAFIQSDKRYESENFQAIWKIKVGEHVWSRRILAPTGPMQPGSRRQLYQLRVVPADPVVRDKYPALSMLSELLYIKKH